MSHKLFEPIALRNVEAKNRLWVPPMCQYAVVAEDGVATDWHLVHYGSMASGGAGAIIVEATAVVPEGRISPTCLGIWNDEQRDALARVAAFMKSQGAVAGIQLAHAGRKASVPPEWGMAQTEGAIPLDEGGWEVVGPSPVEFPGLRQPRELDHAGIEDVVSAFAAAARRAVDAGFELVELHGAHGYLVSSFLSPLSNHRQDCYGGTLANRARILLDIVDAVRTEVGDDIALAVRLSATDWLEDGFQIDDAAQVSRWLAEHGVDIIDVSSGGVMPARIQAGPGYQVPLASRIRNEAGVPVAAVGLITDPVQAEHILVTEQADVVLVGREMLRDPHFAHRAAAAVGHNSQSVPGPYRRAYRTVFGN